jgi:hypothetical protein
MPITLVNHATSLPAPEVLGEIADAISRQIVAHLISAWGRQPVTVQVGDIDQPDASSSPDPSVVPVVIFDDADQAGTLGYHDRDPHGRAYARVFAAPVLEHGGDWARTELSVASVISHEVLEVIVDPYVNLWADDGAGRLYALEVADPVEAATYRIGGVTVSNFVLPAWFDPGAPGPYDQLGSLRAPFALDDGGYAIVATETAVREVFGVGGRPEWRTETKHHVASRSARRLRALAPQVVAAAVSRS